MCRWHSSKSNCELTTLTLTEYNAVIMQNSISLLDVRGYVSMRAWLPPNNRRWRLAFMRDVGGVHTEVLG